MDVEATGHRIDLLCDTGRHDRAIQEIHELLARHPEESGILHVFLAHVLFQLDRDHQAHEAALVGVRERPELSSAHEILARTALSTGRPALALRAAEEVLRLAPDDPDGHDLRAFALLQLRDPDGARHEILEALRLDPDNHVRHMRVGQVLHDHDPATARRAYETALRIRPDHPTTHQLLAALDMGRGRWRKGAATAATLARMDPQNEGVEALLRAVLVRTASLLFLVNWLWFVLSNALGRRGIPVLVVAVAGIAATAAVVALPVRAFRSLPGSGRHFVQRQVREPRLGVWLVGSALTSVLLAMGTVLMGLGNEYGLVVLLPAVVTTIAARIAASLAIRRIKQEARG